VVRHPPASITKYSAATLVACWAHTFAASYACYDPTLYGEIIKDQNKYQIWKRGLSDEHSCGGEPEARPVYISGTPGQLQRVREVSRLRVSEKRSCWGIELLKSHASGCPSCLRVGKTCISGAYRFQLCAMQSSFTESGWNCLFRETIVVFTNFLVVPRGITCAANVLPCPRAPQE
jgi:hypothetical protein